MGGEHSDLPAFLINVHKIDSLPDAVAYVSRLQGLSKVFDQVIEHIKERADTGMLPPHFTFHYVAADMKAFIAGCDKTDASNVLLNDLTEKLAKTKIEKANQEKLVAEAKIIIAKDVKASYQKLLNYWLVLDKKQTKEDGAWALPYGQEYYAYCLRHSTTTTMSPDEIYETGQKEVARIHQEMHKIMKQVKFKSDSLQEFFCLSQI